MNNRRLVPPGHRDALRRNAGTLGAPHDILADPDSVPAGVTNSTVAGIWAALSRGRSGGAAADWRRRIDAASGHRARRGGRMRVAVRV
jgi:hypothetical protein